MLSQSWQHALHSLEGWQMRMLRQQLQRPPVPCNITAIVKTHWHIVKSGSSHNHSMARVYPMLFSLASCRLLDKPISRILRSSCIAHIL